MKRLFISSRRAKAYYEREAKERMLAGKKQDPPVNLPEGKGDSRDKAGAAFGVSGKMVDHAVAVLTKGNGASKPNQSRK